MIAVAAMYLLRDGLAGGVVIFAVPLADQPAGNSAALGKAPLDRPEPELRFERFRSPAIRRRTGNAVQGLSPAFY